MVSVRVSSKLEATWDFVFLYHALRFTYRPTSRFTWVFETTQLQQRAGSIPLLVPRPSPHIWVFTCTHDVTSRRHTTRSQALSHTSHLFEKEEVALLELSLVNSLACSRLQHREESGSNEGARNSRRGLRGTEDCSRSFFARSLFHCSLALFARARWLRAWPSLFTHPLCCYKGQIQISDEDWTLVKGHSNHSQICCGTVVDLKWKREKMIGYRLSQRAFLIVKKLLTNKIKLRLAKLMKMTPPPPPHSLPFRLSFVNPPWLSFWGKN